MTPIELLCPARNAEVGMAAVRYGADAVYIGGPGFGARAAAGNSVADIERLCHYAHLFGVRVYVTFNTILYDHELSQAEALIHQLYAAGVDALIIQDLALLRLNLPPIALHASTQMDNCTPEKAQFLEQCGFSQIVVARELSLDQIRSIHQATTLPIEAFVHGALCVSYSGRCYVSQHCFDRSANRGCCSQFCRLSFDLIDAQGQVLSTAHHLSLRDMNRSNSIEQMLDAGVRSFKIEGRLKDENYVKNVCAHYRQTIDRILTRRSSEFCRASHGTSHFDFQPHIDKTFNRGYTEYFLHHRTPDVASMRTPKAIGAPVGRVSRVNRRDFSVQGQATFANGDGLCYFDEKGQLRGFRVNRVEGRQLHPLQMPQGLRPGVELFRNEDRVFEQTLQRSSTQRLLGIALTLSERSDATGYALTAQCENGIEHTLLIDAAIDTAQKPQRDNIVRNLSKLGSTPFEAISIDIHTQGERFIPASALSEWRRLLVEQLSQKIIDNYLRDTRRPVSDKLQLDGQYFDYTANIANQEARAFLQEHGAVQVDSAYEIEQPSQATLMTCRHCLRYSHGQCPRETGRKPTWQEPLALRLPNGRTFPLSFDCAKCEMSVHSD